MRANGAPGSNRTMGSFHVRARAGGLVLVLVAMLVGACSASAVARPSVGTPSGMPGSTPVASAAGGPSAAVSGRSTATPVTPATGSPAAGPTFPLTLTDDEGHAVVLPATPRRIVSLTPATTEILFAIGAGDRVVATTDFDDYPPQVTTLPHVASYSSVDVEKIVALGADLVIAGGNGFNSPDALDQLRRVGVPVLTVYAASVDGVLGDVDLVGRAVGRPAEAEALAARMRAGFDAVRTVTAAGPHPRVFYELDATKEIFGPADDSFIAEMITDAGGTPITTGSTTVFSMPLERLVAADPQVIVLGDAAYGTTPDAVKSRPGWGTMTAVRTGAIRPVDDTVVTRPGPRLVAGLRDLALAIQPGLTLPPLPSPDAGTTGSP